ncbi:MAG: glycosyltransferase [candidate division Zixibacteria bacterium]|nr:glycosyltransferase [candidate division Zixibacteria bacterium]
MKKSLRLSIASSQPEVEYPPVTVIIPARNEADNIANLIDGLKQQDYPEDKIMFRIIDDFSTDNTFEIVSGTIENDIRFKILKLSEQKEFLAETPLSSKKRVIDFGIKKAGTDVLLFTDADCIVSPTWVSSMVRKLSEDYSIVAGYVGFRYGTFIEGILALESLATRIIASGSIGLGGAVTCSGGNLCYRKSVYEKIGGLEKFGSSFSGDDTLFIQEAINKGAKAVFNFDSKSFVYTRERGTIKDIFIQRLRRLGITTNFKLNMFLASGFLFLYCYLLALTPILIIADNTLTMSLLTTWIWKFIVDLIILRFGARIFQNRDLLKFLPVTGLIYPYYIAIVGTFSFAIKGSWKGRTS